MALYLGKSLRFAVFGKKKLKGNIMRPVKQTVNSVSTSKPIRVSWRGSVAGFGLALGVDLNPGVLTYTVEHTFDDPVEFSDDADYNANATWRPTDGLTALTVTDESNITFPTQAVRLNVTAFTSGSAEITVIQQG